MSRNYPQSTGVHASFLGTSLDSPDGQLTATGDANADAINAFLQGTGHNNFRELRRSLTFTPPGIGISKSIATGAVNAASAYKQIFGRMMHWEGGQGYPIAESGFYGGSFERGGELARLVCLDKTNLTDGAMIVDDSYGLTFTGSAMIQGYFAAGLNKDLHWHPSDTNLGMSTSTAQGLYADIGLLVMPNAGTGIGNGKFNAQALTIACCNVGLQCGLADAEVDNADQFVIDDYRAPFCFTGIKLKNNQSVGHRIGLYEGVWCPVMIDAERGGKMTVDHATIEYPDGTLLTTGNLQGAESGFVFNKVTLDATAGANCKVIEQTGTDFRVESFMINHLHCDPTVNYADNFFLKPHAALRINSGDFLREGMIVATGGTNNYMPNITLLNCRFNASENPDNIMSASSSGAYTMTVLNPCDVYGNHLPSKSWTVNAAGVRTDHIVSTSTTDVSLW